MRKLILLAIFASICCAFGCSSSEPSATADPANAGQVSPPKTGGNTSTSADAKL